MIVIDTSALIAIFEKEADAATYAGAIANADRLVMSALNVYETAMVLRSRRGEAAVNQLWIYLDEAQVEIAAFDREQARLAAIAFGRFGKGIHSKAKLNLADCAAYALAKSLSLPLLFKGDDFAHTDIEPWH
ncbi:type II toxin-antitoxin system VapC family toxin [Rhizobium sp. WYCCWR 11279]|uniref:Ribonuclease VapC n=1 Tax=Rhizobium changzhiense TaxID=2692317 RepID=A0A7Z0RG87_9HYPH|nr:type II toxin-antitoxin system VapC family toxin [Rhizobium changzhiense]NNU47013.1 type II toxin-antitoxin system VapC family toxin [Rhizobium changzhiense]NZD60936.1 type II toxin-antitoxin system VapC family toxin [Rhizobium changzhiense]